jgi:hypothetical protein
VFGQCRSLGTDDEPVKKDYSETGRRPPCACFACLLRECCKATACNSPYSALRTYENYRSIFEPGKLKVQYTDNRLIKLAQFITNKRHVLAMSGLLRHNQARNSIRKRKSRHTEQGFGYCKFNIQVLLIVSIGFLGIMHPFKHSIQGFQLQAIQSGLHGEYGFYIQCTELLVTSLRQLVTQQKFSHK